MHRHLALLRRSDGSPVLHEEMKLEDTYIKNQHLSSGCRLRTRCSVTSLHCIRGAIKIPAGVRSDFPDPADPDTTGDVLWLIEDLATSLYA